MDVLTRKAWNVVLRMMERSRGVWIAQLFAYFGLTRSKGSPHLQPESVRTSFIKRMAQFKSTGWQYYPGTQIPITSDSDPVALDDPLLHHLHAESCEILHVYSQGDPLWLARSLSFEQFLMFSLPESASRILRCAASQSSRSLLRSYVASLDTELPRGDILSAWTASKMELFTSYISHVYIQPDVLQTVADSIVVLLHSSHSSSSRISQEIQSPIETDVGTCEERLPLLHIAHQLLRSDEETPCFLFKLGLSDVLELLAHKDSRHDLETPLLLLFGAISRRITLWRYIFHGTSRSDTQSWIPAIFSNRSYEAHTLLDNVDIQYLVVALMDHAVSQSHEVGFPLDESLCQGFVRVLSNPKGPALKRVAVSVLLCCGVLTEERIRPLANALRVHFQCLPIVIAAVADHLVDLYTAFTKTVASAINRNSEQKAGPIVGFIELLHSVISTHDGDDDQITPILAMKSRTRILELVEYVEGCRLTPKRGMKLAIFWHYWDVCDTRSPRFWQGARPVSMLVPYVSWWSRVRDGLDSSDGSESEVLDYWLKREYPKKSP